MDTTAIGPYLQAGTVDLGECCHCDKYDMNGVLIEHVPQYQLWRCQNPPCDHWTCKQHKEPCGFCVGCCAEDDGLDSHVRVEERSNAG